MTTKKMLFALSMILVSVNIFAQSVLRGKLIDDETNNPVVHAIIEVEKMNLKTMTDEDGKFYIEVPQNGDYTIKIKHLAHQTTLKKISTQTKKNVVIRIKPVVNSLNQVVITATGTHRKAIESPIPVKTINGRDIKSLNTSSLQDVLSKLSSEYTFTNATMGGQLSANGLNGKYILMLINGRKTTSEDFLVRINTNNVKRIELLNSAASTLYGSDALGGVINIITDDNKNKVDITAGTRVGERGQMTNSLNADFNIGRLSSYTSYQRQKADSWRLSDLEEKVNKKGQIELVPTEKLMYHGYESHNVTQHFGFVISEKLKAFANGSYYYSTTNRPLGGYDYDVKHRNYDYGGGLKYYPAKNIVLEADYNYNNYNSAYLYFRDAGKIKEGELFQHKTVENNRATLKGIFRINPKNKLSSGIEYIDDIITSQRDNLDKVKNYTLAAYFQNETKLSKHFELVAGLRYTYNENFKSHLAPALSLMYINDGLRVRASYSTGFKIPEQKDLYFKTESARINRLSLGNPNLRPEESRDLTLNMEYSHQLYNVSVTGFVKNVRNLIDYRPLSAEESKQYEKYNEVIRKENINEANIKGLTFSGSRYIGAGFSIAGGYTVLKAIDVKEEKDLDRSFSYSGNIKADWNKNFGMYDLNINFVGYGNSSRYNNAYDYYYPAFAIFDLNSTHNFKLKNIDLTAGVGIENIFDWKDDRPFNVRKPYTAVTPGRTVYANLVIRFRK